MAAPATTPVRIFPAVAHPQSPAVARCVPLARSAAVARVTINVFIKFLSLFRLMFILKLTARLDWQGCHLFNADV
jgi:hypothetical protein